MNPLSTSQHWFRWWLGAVRQQVITWANVDPDLCHHRLSLSHNEVNPCDIEFILVSSKTYSFPIISKYCDGTGTWNPSSWWQRPIYSPWSILCLLLTWQQKEPELQQLWYWRLPLQYFTCSIWRVNTLRPKQNDQHFADDIFSLIPFH